ncbi:MAG: hypothetical protein ACSHX0_11280 [Akkermansiaceae bacterium]
MGVISEFTKSITNIVRIGGKLNNDQRKEIRDLVGELGDELDRAIRLAQFYLEGGKGIRDSLEMSDYLVSGSHKLMGSYHEYKICAGLYALHDRFDQIFDPVKLAISVGSIQKIHDLINDLSHGERMVIDDLDSMFLSLKELANDLQNAAPDEEEGIKNSIKVALKIEHQSLEEHRKRIKMTMREVFDNM